jgi:hypothetical protein
VTSPRICAVASATHARRGPRARLAVANPLGLSNRWVLRRHYRKWKRHDAVRASSIRPRSSANSRSIHSMSTVRAPTSASSTAMFVSAASGNSASTAAQQRAIRHKTMGECCSRTKVAWSAGRAELSATNSITSSGPIRVEDSGFSIGTGKPFAGVESASQGA